MQPSARAPVFEGPCTDCSEKLTCTVYPSLSGYLYGLKAFQHGDTLDEIDHFIAEACRRWLRTEGAPIPNGRPRTVRLSAFFDLAASLLYSMELVAPDKGGFRFRKAGVSHGEFVVFPFTWMCPLCVTERKERAKCYLPGAKQERGAGKPAKDYPRIEQLAKLRARAIGDVGFKVLMSILRAVLGNEKAMHICTGGGRRGDVDVTIANESVLAFGEVKAKPLVCFPLVIKTGKMSRKHRWEIPPSGPAWIHISATDFWVPIEKPNSKSWPMNQLVAIASDAKLVREIETAWYTHLEAYRRWKDEPEHLRWLRFGCGNFSTNEGGIQVEKRVANTKELPGLDRTDDIKKGTSQLLLFSRLKYGCNRSALKAVLLGNVYAETHEHDYLGPLSGLRLINSEDSRTEFVFDGIIGLTKNVLNDELLRGLLKDFEGSKGAAVSSPVDNVFLADRLLGSPKKEPE